MNPLNLLLTLLVFCVLIWAARKLLSAFGIGDPLATVVWVVIVLLAVWWVVQSLGYGPAAPVLRLR